MPDTPTMPVSDPYEAIERVQDEQIKQPEQPPMDDDASGMPDGEGHEGKGGN
jgi:hypothetical protein